jgi:hypothetical protein
MYICCSVCAGSAAQTEQHQHLIYKLERTPVTSLRYWYNLAGKTGMGGV